MHMNLLNMDYPPKRIKKVESLRHLYLNNLIKNKKQIIKKILLYNINSWGLFRKKYLLSVRSIK